MEIPKEEDSYQMKTVLLDGLKEAWSFRQVSDGFYVAGKKSGSGSVLFGLDKKGKVRKEISLSIEGNVYSIEDFRMEEDGSISCLVVTAAEDDNGLSHAISCIRFGQDGKPVSSTALPFPDGEAALVSDGIFTESGICILAGNDICFFNGEGKLLWRKGRRGNFLGLLDGSIYLVSTETTGSSFRQMEAAGKERRNYRAGILPAGISASWKGSGYDLEAVNSDGIYGYSFQSQKMTRLLSWLEQDVVIEDNSIYGFSCLGDGKYALLMDANPGICISLVSKSGQEKQTRKGLALFFDDSQNYSANLKLAVAEWNKEHENCRITAEAKTRQELALEIVSGNSPDILAGSVFLFSDLAQKGCFADWYGLMEHDPAGIQKSDLEDHIRELYEAEDGKLYYFPAYYSVMFYGADAKDVKEKTRWSLSDMDACLERKENPVPATDFGFGIYGIALTKAQFFGKMLSYSFWDYYDKDGLKIKNLRELAAFTERWWTEDIEKTPLLSMGASAVKESLALMKELYGKDYRLIGFPCEEGSGVSISPGCKFAITKKVEDKAEAWEFVRSFFTYEAQSEHGGIHHDNPYCMILDDVFPVRKDAFENIWQDMIDNSNTDIKDLTEEDFAMAERYVLSADRTDDYLGDYYDVYDIIWEEMQAYYSGDQDLEKTIDIMKNRVGLYTKEKK